MKHPHASEVKPPLRLVKYDRPPTGQTLWLIGPHRVGYAGHWQPRQGVIAWCPLPAFTDEQKQLMQTLLDQGIDLSEPPETTS